MLTALIAAATTVGAQNVQLHYDLGHSLWSDLTKRPSVTTTVEMFKPDKWGSTYMFTDIDYQRDGVAGAYWEISREFNVTANKQWAVHTEYNGGLSSDEELWTATRFQHAVLMGGAWNWHSKDFSRTFSIQTLYITSRADIIRLIPSAAFSSPRYGASILQGRHVRSVGSASYGTTPMRAENGFC